MYCDKRLRGGNVKSTGATFPLPAHFVYNDIMPLVREHPLKQRVNAFAVRFQENLVAHERRFVAIAIATFVAIITLLGAWKVWSFGYNGLDLAIYRQVSATSLHGQLFSFTIHPHSYLGDHLELFLLALVPFFKVWSHPLTLVFLQALALGIAAIPLTKIARHFLGTPWHLLFTLAYLANPVLQNMALFEFHLLPFAIPLLSFALLAFLEQRYGRYLLWLVLALTVREDVSLVVAGLGVLALVDRRSWRWSVVPFLLGAAWFVVALKLTALFSGYGQYKFLVYYGWLGSSISEIIHSALLKPWFVIQHLFSLSNLAFLLGVLLPFAYLPLFRLRWLIPVVPTFLQLFLVRSPGEVLLDIHYPALLIPFFVVGAAAAFRSVLHPPNHGVFRALANERAMTTILFIVVVVYSMFVIGPLAQSLPVLARTPSIAERVRLERDVVNSLPPRGTVAGYETLTALSDRPRLYSLHYVFLGNKQYSQQPYELPDDATVVLVDLRDFLMYQLLYKTEDPPNRRGYERIRNLLRERNFKLTAYLDRFAVFERSTSAVSATPLYTTVLPTSLKEGISTHNELRFDGWTALHSQLTLTSTSFRGHSYTTLPLSLTFHKTEPSNAIYQIEFMFIKNSANAYHVLMPLGGGIFPTSDWAVDQPVTTNYDLLVPKTLAHSPFEVEVRVLKLQGDVSLNGIRSIELRYNTYETVGPTIKLGQVQKQ